MSESQTIADLFFADLMSCCKEIEQCFEPLYLAFGDGSGDSVFGVNTRPGYIFDDYFWDVFHAHPLHVCHVTRLTDGPQFDEGRVFEIRFKISEEQVALKAKLSKMEDLRVEVENVISMARSFASFPSWLKQLEEALARESDAE